MAYDLIRSASPHIHSGADSRKIMADVIIALLPAIVASIVIFGVRSLEILVACACSAVLAEFLFNLIARRQQSIGDLSAVVTGLLLGLNLSTNVAIWQCIVGSVFAIVLVKCMFGGMGKNFANPAISGRVFMLLAFSSVAGGAKPVLGAAADAVSSATPLEQIARGASEELPSLLDMFLGLRGGAIGETCVLALLIGFAYLVARRVIKWHIPVIFMGTVFVCAWIGYGDFTTAVYELMGGGLVLGAVFMATDYVTTPITAKGRMLFALGCGLVTFAIRYFFSYPEGVSFSILFMNILSPLLEKLTRNKPLGGV